MHSMACMAYVLRSKNKHVTPTHMLASMAATNIVAAPMTPDLTQWSGPAQGYQARQCAGQHVCGVACESGRFVSQPLAQAVEERRCPCGNKHDHNPEKADHDIGRSRGESVIQNSDDEKGGIRREQHHRGGERAALQYVDDVALAELTPHKFLSSNTLLASAANAAGSMKVDLIRFNGQIESLCATMVATTDASMKVDPKPERRTFSASHI